MLNKSHLIGACAIISVGAFATEEAPAPQNTMQCTKEELKAYIANYEKGLGTAIAAEPTTSFPEFKKNDISRRITDPNENQEKTLCSVIMDAEFDVSKLRPDFSKLNEAYEKLKLLMASEGNGPNFSIITSEAIKKAMDQMWEKAKKSACDLARSSTAQIDPLANALYKEGLATGKQLILSDERVKELGVTSFDKPIWQQMAGKEIDNQLDQYADQAKWYEEGWTIEDATGDIIEGEIDDGKDDWIDGMDKEDNDLADLPF